MDLDGPALAPPEGVVPQLDNPPNNNKLAIAVLSVCSVFATICCLMRGYARLVLLRKFQIEEVLVVVAYGFFWGATYALLVFIETPGYFVHTWNVRLRDVIPIQYYVLIFGICYSFVLPSLKIAILIEWCRVFSPIGSRLKSPFWVGCATIIFVQVTANIAIIVALNLQCIPHRAIYDFRVQGDCFDLYKLQVGSASIHLICDVVIFLLPQRTIWTLKMSWKKRLGVSIIFGLGLLACISAAFRCAVTVAHGRSADSVYTLGPLAFWAMAEMTCGFFIICLPCIPKILKETALGRHMIQKWSRGSSGSRGSSARRRKPYDGNQLAGMESYATGSRGGRNRNNNYKLEQDVIRMNPLEGSESTERLHDGSSRGGGARGLAITRTTQFVFIEGDNAVSDKHRL
ncbi:hypothetical protein HK57_00157 [Aspergillus ustus]|uniref:Rhodopsin domain-containing protein n=1 Tax=Aspergillus ustus TaxID=40382 RepID=A0A0C1EFD7_ASPUT|nr:hypothetical protein HK57_00157 [Aspergillus ustus]